jgi:hypothetical protein
MYEVEQNTDAQRIRAIAITPTQSLQDVAITIQNSMRMLKAHAT